MSYHSIMGNALIHLKNTYNNLLHIKHLQQTSERENIVSKCKNVKRSELEQDRASVQSAELCPSGRQFRF